MAEYVRDDFNRTLGSSSSTPGSLGTGYLGGPWSVSVSGSNVGWYVDGSRARTSYMSGSGGSANAMLASAVPAVEAHGALSFRSLVDAMPSVMQLWFRAAGPTATLAGYGLRFVRPANGVGCTVELLRGTVDAPVVIGTVATGVTFPTFGSYATLELELLGASPTTVRGRWFPTSSPPTDDAGWTSVSDGSGPQGAGAYAMRTTRSGTGSSTAGELLVGWVYAADPLRPVFTTSFDDSGLLASFDAATLTTGDPVAHLWTFGDGTATSTLQNATHQYPAAGTYSVTYTATTRWGTKRSSTQSVVVPGGVPLPVPPVRPSIYVNGEDVCDRVYQASWSMGRSRWPDETNGSACTLQLRGRLTDVVNGAPIVIALPPGAPPGTRTLFTGEVDSIVESIDPTDALTVTTITAMDTLAFLGRWHILPATSFAEASLPTRTAALAPRGTTVYRQKWPGVAGSRWPTLKSLSMSADKLREKTYLGILRDGLRASIASAYTAPDGAVVYGPLDPPPGFSPVVLDLDTAGPDCPAHEDVDRATVDGMVNRWTVGADGSGLDRVERPSVEAYGESVWSVGTGVLKTDSTFPLTDSMVEQLREPFAARRVTVPVRSWDGAAMLAEPLDIASREGVLFGILGVRQSVSLSAWDVELELDRDPWTMTGIAPPVPPTPARVTTQTFVCDMDALLASPNMGAGRSTRLPVGLWSGDKFRALIRFNLAWAHTPVKVTLAELLLDTAGQDAVGYGSSPQVQIDRVTGYWSEGSSGGDGPPWTFNTSNAVVFPGPAVTSSGRVTKNVTNAENTSVVIAMTAIARAWADGANNRGIRIMSTNEGSTTRTTEFYSSEYSGPTRRPQLRVTYEW